MNTQFSKPLYCISVYSHQYFFILDYVLSHIKLVLSFSHFISSPLLMNKHSKMSFPRTFLLLANLSTYQSRTDTDYMLYIHYYLIQRKTLWSQSLCYLFFINDDIVTFDRWKHLCKVPQLVSCSVITWTDRQYLSLMPDS